MPGSDSAVSIAAAEEVRSLCIDLAKSFECSPSSAVAAVAREAAVVSDPRPSEAPDLASQD